MRHSFASPQSLLLLGAALSIAACGGDETRPAGTSNNNTSNNNTSNNNNPNNEQALMQFCTDVKGKFSAYLTSCYGGDGTALSGIFAIDCESWPAEVMAGHRTFDASKTAACLAYFDMLQCEVGFGDEATNPCEAALVSVAPVGTVCEDNDICADGLFCDRPAFGCPGTCAARAALNAACDVAAFDGCVDGAICEDDGAGAGTCITAIVEGQACQPGKCDRNLTCDEGICKGPTALGEVCNGYCAGFMRCIETNGVQTCQLPAKVGEACEATETCVFGSCGSDGLCAGPALVGDVCGLDGMSYTPCIQGYCEAPDFTSPGVCAAKKVDNATCMMDLECESDNCDSGMCAALMCQ